MRKTWHFTLVELLVVIAIMAILTAILLPSLNTARSIARGMKCLGNLKQQGNAVVSYVGDCNGWLPVRDYPHNSGWGWKLYLAPYLVDLRYTTAGEPYSLTPNWNRAGVFLCPEWRLASCDDKNNLGGYAWCYAVGVSDSSSGYPRRRLESLLRFSQTVLIGDSVVDSDTTSNSLNYCQIQPPSWSSGTGLLLSPKHRNGFDSLWLDLHVDWQGRGWLLKGQFNDCDYYYVPKTK